MVRATPGTRSIRPLFSSRRIMACTDGGETRKKRSRSSSAALIHSNSPNVERPRIQTPGAFREAVLIPEPVTASERC